MLKKSPKVMFRFRSHIRDLEHHMAAIGEELAQEVGLCESDLRILEHLKMEDKQPVNTLGRKINLKSGSMTAAISRLEAKDFVERGPHPYDRRKVVVTMKRQGKKWLKEVRKKHANRIEEKLNVLSTREQEVFVRLLGEISEEEH